MHTLEKPMKVHEVIQVLNFVRKTKFVHFAPRNTFLITFFQKYLSFNFALFYLFCQYLLLLRMKEVKTNIIEKGYLALTNGYLVAN